MLRNICYIASVCGVPPAEADRGRDRQHRESPRPRRRHSGARPSRRHRDLRPGRRLGRHVSIADAIAHGDLPGIAYVIADGEIVVSGRSRQTPPPKRKLFFSCCDLHGGSFVAS